MGCTNSKPHCCCCTAPSKQNPHPNYGTRNPTQHLLTNQTVGSTPVPSANLTLTYSYLTQRGYYPDSPDRPNQDTCSVTTNFQSNPNLHLFSVFDGHGQFGTECSDFVKETLTLTLVSDPDLTIDPVKSFQRAFEATNRLLHSSNVDDSMSGTTAVSVLVYGDKLFVANVGDSRAVMGMWSNERGCVVAEDLSCDQTPFRKDECERVKKCGARVLSVEQMEGLKDPEVQSWGEEDEDEEGDPPRLWVEHGMYPGTAFTRSVGDLMAEGIGVVAMPEVKEVRITEDCLFFVVASDGVFEFLSSQKVVDMVTSFQDPRDACAAIAAESYRTWLQHENRTDDITIIIVHFKDKGNPDAPLNNGRAASEKTRAEKFAGPDIPNDRSSSCVAPSPEKV